MVTYRTHGVFEESIRESSSVHRHGGRVYMDGANIERPGRVRAPADIGADVATSTSQYSLHPTAAAGRASIGVVAVSAVSRPPGWVRARGGERSREDRSPGVAKRPSWPREQAHAYIRIDGRRRAKRATERGILRRRRLPAPTGSPPRPSRYGNARGVAHGSRGGSTGGPTSAPPTRPPRP